MVGLAGPRNRQKIAFDPQNTSWSRDTDRFGHRHLEKMGWKPGDGLGSSAANRAITTHVKITLKDDTLGLGAKSAIASQDANNWAPGLDSFQALLSRLNGSEPAQTETTTVTETETETISENGKITMWESETRISQSYNRIGKWGNRVKFVKGERLGATITEELVAKTKSERSAKEEKIPASEDRSGSAKKSRKHKRSKTDGDSAEDNKKHKKRKRKHSTDEEEKEDDTKVRHKEHKKSKKSSEKSSSKKSSKTHSRPESDESVTSLTEGIAETSVDGSKEKHKKKKSKKSIESATQAAPEPTDVDMTDAPLAGKKRKMKEKKSKSDKSESKKSRKKAKTEH
ncbi:hypothetical protein BZA70DRAFT_309759 [Myxozyma melibiosi]|uniref:Protein PXR1 n=1 Tax=Myxozyma melibiosi TaxID=54550 RepID=A0ABR1F897_9ASCO